MPFYFQANSVVSFVRAVSWIVLIRPLRFDPRNHTKRHETQDPFPVILLLDSTGLPFKPVLQPGNHYFEFARLDNGFVISADKGKIVSAQLKGQRAALAWLKMDLRKSFEPFPGRR